MEQNVIKNLEPTVFPGEPFFSDVIVAPATSPGGALSIVRLSGNGAVDIADTLWQAARPLAEARSHTAHFGQLMDGGDVLDECVATVFRAPCTFTGEDIVEFSCHASGWIVRRLLALLIEKGARMAHPGEFSQRAFLNGRMDLAEAEGIADLIASQSRSAHRIAMNQMRGGFSKVLARLTDRLIHFASMLELELDFSEEEVEFADRGGLLALAREIKGYIDRLADSYGTGKVIKEGIPVAIAGIPNAGKSTLLNLLLGDDKAIVSDIAGTTRDIIEDTLMLDGVLYRFIDTAGLRATTDTVERLGIERAVGAAGKAAVVIRIFDATQPLAQQLQTFNNYLSADKPADGSSAEETTSAKSMPVYIDILNKTDLDSADAAEGTLPAEETIGNSSGILPFSAKTGKGLDRLVERLKEVSRSMIDEAGGEDGVLVTNLRHYDSLRSASASLQRAIVALREGISADLVAQDIRLATTALGEITGKITSDTILHNIFENFCIGK